jgi:multiple sugar transport system ATP-binding protein
MNLLDLPVADGGVKFGGTTYPVEREHLAGTGDSVTVGIRPEDLTLTGEGQGLPVTVDVVEELGADAYIYGEVAAHQHQDPDLLGEARPFIARVDGRTPPEKGQTVYLAPNPGHVHVFDTQTGERLGD